MTTRINPFQLDILKRMDAGERLERDDSGWYFGDGEWFGTRTDGRAAFGMLRRIPPWIEPDGPGVSGSVVNFKITAAGRAALAGGI